MNEKVLEKVTIKEPPRRQRHAKPKAKKVKIKAWQSNGGGTKKIVATTMLENLVSVPLFAKKHGVSDNTVKYHINRGNIHIILIGELHDRYIDWSVYKDYKFEKQ